MPRTKKTMDNPRAMQACLRDPQLLLFWLRDADDEDAAWNGDESQSGWDLRYHIQKTARRNQRKAAAATGPGCLGRLTGLICS